MNITNYWPQTMILTDKEAILRDELGDWLPSSIIDGHCHINLKKFINIIDEQTYGHLVSTFDVFSLEQSEQLDTILFPNKNLRKLFFPFPFYGIDFAKANTYLLDNIRPQHRFALLGIPDDISYTVDMIRKKNVAALKMYYSSVRPIATSIYQFFKKEILEEAQACHVPIILHLPKPITESTSELIQLLSDFPKLGVVLAHLGLPSYKATDCREIYSKFSTYSNLYMDTAMVTSKEIIYLALKYFGTDKIIFGTDEPVNMIRGVKYQHPTLGQRVGSDFLYHWVNKDDQECCRHLFSNCVHFHWQSLIAVKEAITDLKSTSQELIKNDIFYHTAKRVYNFH